MKPISKLNFLRCTQISAFLLSVVVTTGCVTMPGSSASSDSKTVAPVATSTAAPTAAPTAKSTAAPATKSTVAAPAVKSTAGMDSQGRVIDSSKVEAGSGQKVKGLKDWEGEITGKPVANSKFSNLQIGMSMKQSTDLAGAPTDQGAYMTGKAWIPFYFGSDRHRYEMTYKGQGRLIFAGGSMGDFSGGNLIWIIHSGNESGNR